SITVERKTARYLQVLDLVLRQSRSLMFIDPNLDPSSSNYREFIQLLLPLVQRQVHPVVEIHRSFCRGDGPARTFPNQSEWKKLFARLSAPVNAAGLQVEVFFWEDFHDRYLITDVIGIIVPSGFDVTSKPNEFSTWGRL